MIPLNNYSEGVNWSIQGLPPGAAASFLGRNPDGSLTLRIQLSGGTPLACIQ